MNSGSPVEVSVIILTYRQPATIGRAIESVLSQKTTFDYEIILADDCSPDDTGAICREYASRYPDRIRLVARKRNIGLVDSYFECVEMARGRYIADCAGDDFWLGDNSLQQRRDMLASNPTLSLVHADWINVDDSGRVISKTGSSGPRYKAITSGRDIRDMLLAHIDPVAVHLSTALYRADMLRDALAAYPGLVHNKAYCCEDLPLMAALFSRGDVGYINVPMLAYTVGGNTVSNPADLRRAFEFYEATASCTVDLADFYGTDRSVIMPFMRGRVDIMMAIAFRLRDRKLAQRTSAFGHRTGVSGGWKTKLRRLLLYLFV